MKTPKLTTPLPGITSNRFHMERVQLDVPTRITNASSKLPLVLKPAPVRPGSEDFLRCKSLTTGGRKP